MGIFFASLWREPEDETLPETKRLERTTSAPVRTISFLSLDEDILYYTSTE